MAELPTSVASQATHRYWNRGPALASPLHTAAPLSPPLVAAPLSPVLRLSPLLVSPRNLLDHRSLRKDDRQADDLETNVVR